MSKTSMPTVDYSDCDFSLSSEMDPKTLEQSNIAVQHFIDHGCVLLKGIYKPSFLQELYDEFEMRYKQYFTDKKFDDALKVGDKRTMVTVDISGKFNNPQFYANPVLHLLMRGLLGNKFILNGVGGVTSLPGSKAQKIHRDHANIYYDDVIYDPNKNFDYIKDCPPYCITAVLPLVPITDVNGNTRMWLGTHLNRAHVNRESNLVFDEGGVDFTADLGSCMIMDYRIVHAGCPNNSDKIRPIIYNVYSKPWFRDSVNYMKQKSLIISKENYELVPDQYKYLFMWSQYI